LVLVGPPAGEREKKGSRPPVDLPPAGAAEGQAPELPDSKKDDKEPGRKLPPPERWRDRASRPADKNPHPVADQTTGWGAK